MTRGWSVPPGSPSRAVISIRFFGLTHFNSSRGYDVSRFFHQMPVIDRAGTIL
jgi:hypothetical protein